MKRLILWFQIFAVEITIDGQSAALEMVRDHKTINRILMAQINAKREWHRLRGEYLSLRTDNPWRLT